MGDCTAITCMSFLLPPHFFSPLLPSTLLPLSLSPSLSFSSYSRAYSWIFFLNVPLGVIGTSLAFWQIRDRTKATDKPPILQQLKHLDWVGIVLLIVGYEEERKGGRRDGEGGQEEVERREENGERRTYRCGVDLCCFCWRSLVRPSQDFSLARSLSSFTLLDWAC